MLPLTSLLSQVLVALTIELDNEYEHRAPHFTSDHGVGALGSGAWLISTAMYVNFLRFVPDAGIVMRDLAAAAGCDKPVHRLHDGLRRWGHVTYSPPIATSAKAKDADAVVRPTPPGARSRDLWAQTFADVEERWTHRGLGSLQRTLIPIVEAVDRPLPEYLPIVEVNYRMAPIADTAASGEPSDLGLLALASQALLAMTLDFDAASPLSLCFVQNLLRPLSEESIKVADLTEVSGISKKAWGSAVGHITKPGFATVGPGPGGKGKAVSLTDKGIAARETGRATLSDVEAVWREKCGPPLESLRHELEKVVGDGTPSSPVFAGIEPYPECWRAKLKPLKVLPHQPLVSHRGGYPDGS